MKRVPEFKRSLIFLMALSLFGIQSCSKDAERMDIPEEARLSRADLQTIMETEQYTGAVDDTLAELFQNGNSASGKFADDSCYEATYTETGFTVVFGNCVLNQTDEVNGTLEVVYNTGGGAASFTATYTGFFVGAAEVNGTRTFTLSESGQNGFSFSVESQMTVALDDGRVIQESGVRTLEFQLGETLSEISFGISGNWEVSVDGTTYSVTVSTPLGGNLGCAYLVDGVMDISKNGLQVSVDFGDGSCDNTVTVIYPDGATEEVTL